MTEHTRDEGRMLLKEAASYIARYAGNDGYAAEIVVDIDSYLRADPSGEVGEEDAWLDRETNAMLKAAGRSEVGTNPAFREAVRARLARLRRTPEPTEETP